MTTEFRPSSVDRREGERRAVLEAMPEPTGWHLDRKVPIGLIVLMIAQVVGVVWFFAGIKQDVELLKADSVVLHARDNQNFEALNAAMKTFNDTFARLDAKIDRLIERDHK